MKYSIVNLGCKVNRVESDDYESLLTSRGYAYTESQDADIVVINTCTVTGEAEKKTRKAVRQALKRFPYASVIVTGCASAINPEFFTALDDRIEVVAKPDMQDYLARTIASLEARHVGVSAPSNRARMGVKVQDGCDNACTYCIVHVARGRASSRPVNEIIPDVLRLVESGVFEIVLSGINIGSYNYEGIKLAELLRILMEATSSYKTEFAPFVRFRVSSIEPMDVDDDFVALLASSEGRVCRHLHLPLQSGSSKVLREMARPYDAEDFKRLVDYLRAEVPDISLTTDIIVGFPGETDEDFADTLSAAEYCGFSKIHVFPYSKREGTPAAERADQVNPEVKAARAKALRDLSDQLRSIDYEGRVSGKEYVLVEQPGVGMSESYHEIAVDVALPAGSLVEVSIPDEQKK
ncbi:MAG: tRNA (N(6)-L-threonylcarbamoyladenosine(37)-C(2))-methylthiotransferase MtaB [Eggerthellaceae bacterium]|nr:tRNA (N(6)-L-threonylcarbamoyladenosine(37)-C(2))-methylthiotransferase MtaB [Eggerthellaceae bacterium]